MASDSITVEGTTRLESVSSDVPKNRFSLELVDVLLDKPCVFPLNQSPFTVGILGDENKYSWNLPLKCLLGSELFKVFQSTWTSDGDPLLTLTFDVQTCTWHAVPTFKLAEPQQMRPSRGRALVLTSMMEHSSAHSDESMGNSSSSSVLVPGKKVDFVTVVLHDTAILPSSISGIQMLASLPAVPLAMIASYLEPLECVRNFCSLGDTPSSIPQKLCAVGVQWQQLAFANVDEWNTFGDVNETIISSAGRRETDYEAVVVIRTVLDCLRVLKLTAGGDVFKRLHLGDAICEDGYLDVWHVAGVKEAVFKRIKRLMFAPKLERLSISFRWLPQVIESAKPLSPSLQTMFIWRRVDVDEGTACQGLWGQIARLMLPPATQVRVELMDGAENCHDVAKKACRMQQQNNCHLLLPNVTRISSKNCEHLPFLPPQASFVNLQKLEWTPAMSCWFEECWDEDFDGYDHICDALAAASSFPSLKSVALLVIRRSVMSFVLDALATAAPGVQFLELQCLDDSNDSRQRNPDYYWSPMLHLQDTVEPLSRFPNLRRLKIDFVYWSATGLASTLDFCLALPRGISVVQLDSVDCRDLRTILRVSQSLREAGKRMALTGPAEHITDTCLSSSYAGDFQYRVVVCDLGLDDRDW